jgi:uncharacterized RDD family membrane protein YckC
MRVPEVPLIAAPLWRRAIARGIDVLLSVVAPVMFALATIPPDSGPTDMFGSRGGGAISLLGWVQLLYEPLLHLAPWGATVGKLVLGIRLRSTGGGRLTGHTAYGRWLKLSTYMAGAGLTCWVVTYAALNFDFVSVLWVAVAAPLAIPLIRDILPAFDDPMHRTRHDLEFDTIVVLR